MKRLVFTLLVFTGISAFAKGVGFVFVGDTGTGQPAQFEVAKSIKTYCATNTCDFVALLGDNFYESGVKTVEDPQWKSKFHAPYDDLKLDFYVALGNHDYYGNPQAQVDYKAPNWKLPARYYKFSKEGADFFVIDTNEFSKTQQDWLKKELADSQATWKIVYGHHPIYSYGEHGHDAKLEKSLLPLLKDSADFYLCGHDHDKQVLKFDGITEVVSGVGAKLRPTKKGSKSEFALSTLGFSHLQIDDNKAVLTIRDTKGKTEFEKTVTKTTVTR